MEDYFGFPVGVGIGSPAWAHSALPRRCYYMIWNEWFRDQNLQNGITVWTNDGPDSPGGTGSNLLSRGKRHDYFTSCLPWQQKGTAVDIPIGTVSGAGVPTFQGQSSSTIGHLEPDASSGTPVAMNPAAGWTVNENLEWEDPNLTVTAASINELRESFQRNGKS